MVHEILQSGIDPRSWVSYGQTYMSHARYKGMCVKLETNSVNAIPGKTNQTYKIEDMDLLLISSLTVFTISGFVFSLLFAVVYQLLLPFT